MSQAEGCLLSKMRLGSSDWSAIILLLVQEINSTIKIHILVAKRITFRDHNITIKHKTVIINTLIVFLYTTNFRLIGAID